jgi:hypothetical protein
MFELTIYFKRGVTGDEHTTKISRNKTFHPMIFSHKRNEMKNKGVSEAVWFKNINVDPVET